jgi:glycosyltransferase involved in cell wall biosynthesis
MTRRSRRTRVLVVGQVPPPHHGQAIMVETLLRGRYTDVDLLHLDASYSDTLDQVGGISARKVARMLVVVARAAWTRVTRRPTVLWYHPAGANRSAIVRDTFVLALLRPIFPVTVFHHHARGLVPAMDDLPTPLRSLARRSLRGADVAISPSTSLYDEVVLLDPVTSVVVPNGTAGGRPHRDEADLPRLLFLNLVSEAKGAHWLLDSVGALHRRGLPVPVTFAGAFPSPDEEAAFRRRVSELGLDDHVTLPGLVTGEAKWSAFADAQVFCVPTTYRQESFGLAAVEAASCGLAIVTTDVPGVRDVFRHGHDALLADPDDPVSLVDLLATLCTDADRRRALGRAARLLFEERYTEDRFWAAMDAAFTDVARRTRTSARRRPTKGA